MESLFSSDVPPVAMCPCLIFLCNCIANILHLLLHGVFFFLLCCFRAICIVKSALQINKNVLFAESCMLY